MSDPYIGEITIFAGNFAPRGWSLCNGQLLPINNNQALFALLGTIYGGDGRTTFALPDLRGRVPIGFGQGPGLSNRNLGVRGGTETVGLTGLQVPSHTHDAGVSGATLEGYAGADANATTPVAGNVFGKLQSPVVILAYSDSEANLTPLAGPQLTVSDPVGNAGSGVVHENRQPHLALNYIIALVGIFPSRN